jgi:enamine deaminase RidA (YjgF/YER057c/UK114 family)
MTDIRRHPCNNILSDAVEHNGLVYLAGQVADDLTQDVRGQTEQILASVDALLAKAGSDKSRILSVNIWLADIRTRDAMNQAWTAWADPRNLPARATVEAKLGGPDVLVEIMLTAARSA